MNLDGGSGVGGGGEIMVVNGKLKIRDQADPTVPTVVTAETILKTKGLKVIQIFGPLNLVIITSHYR
ncbi:MAG: hypothetical protein KA715_08965 [Xanthomonadaceae bacterium]|nr:hypothetical protein [Xanthomonadaceae bacterium]